MASMFDYAVFGLTVRSGIALPELLPVQSPADADVTIRVAPLAAPESAPGLEACGDSLLLTIPDVARYRIEGGREIVIDPDPGAPERNIRLFLLGSAFGALLHQRGLLPLHANAVEINGRAVAFMGESGAGKSTLAAWFHDRGYRVIADDVCVVGFDDSGEAFAAPGMPRLRLWREALELMGRDATAYRRSYIDAQGGFDKFDVPIPFYSAAQHNTPLAAVYLLETGDEFLVQPITGVEAADAVFANTYRGAYLSAIGNLQEHWLSAIRLVRHVPAYRVCRAWDLTRLDDQYGQLVDHLSAALDRSSVAAGSAP
jgi:hypothetical protein